MKKTLSELASTVGGSLYGRGDVAISGVASVDDCHGDEITFAVEEPYVKKARKHKVGAVLVAKRFEWLDIPQIVVADPKIAAIQIAYVFAGDTRPKPGVSDLAYIDPDAKVAKTAAVMPFAFVGADAIVGENAVLYPGSYVGQRAKIGAETMLYPNAVVGDRCIVGDRCLIHNNASLGADGFGFYPDGQGAHAKIPQLGIVWVGNDVEIGACTCIDRATFGRTVISDGVKIDNLVQVAHNCLIGKNAMIISQSGLAGSTVIKDRALLAARAATLGHLTVGEGAIVGAMSAAKEDVPDGAMVGGIPARHHIEWKRSLIATQKLPATLKRIRDLEKRIAQLESKLEDDSSEKK